MILDTTHIKKEQKQIINDLVGKPFSFLEAIKLRGIGSKRMIIEEVSPNLNMYMNNNQDTKYANIELRSGGIIIHFNEGLKKFIWLIPFYHLVVYKTNGTSIHAQGRFIRFRNNKALKENKSFFDKLLNRKVNYDFKCDFNQP